MSPRIDMRQDKGSSLKFKKSLPSSFARGLGALANTIGGKILLGVREAGALFDTRGSDDLPARIQSIARNFLRTEGVIRFDSCRLCQVN